MKSCYWLIFFFNLLSWQYASAKTNLISIQEIQSHQSANDCWIIVNNKVYDITRLIKDHETKCNEINLSDFCGKDASAKWSEKENSDHAHKHRSVLKFESNQIGIVNTSLSSP